MCRRSAGGKREDFGVEVSRLGSLLFEALLGDSVDPPRAGVSGQSDAGIGIPVARRYARGVSSDAALGAAVAAVYPIAPIRGCAWVERVASRLARIETANRVCWLKLDGYRRGIDELEAEAEVAAALAGRGLSVAAPVARRDGRYAGAIALPSGPQLALLFDEASGDEVAAPSVAERRAIPALAALRAVWVMALPAAPGATWGQDWLLDPEYLDAHLAMIERLAAAARVASPAASTQP